MKTGMYEVYKYQAIPGTEGPIKKLIPILIISREAIEISGCYLLIYEAYASLIGYF